MSAGVNYVGGRGRIAPRQSKNVERVPKEHFAKQRFIDYTQTAQGVLNTPSASPLFAGSFKHASKENFSPGGTFNEIIQSTSTQHNGVCFGPHVANGPSKPTKQSRLLEMMDGVIRRDESFDASRSRISTMDVKSFAGLKSPSRKRKAEINNDKRPQQRAHAAFTQGFQYPVDANPRALICSPTKEPASIQPIRSNDSQEMLSFGTPSVSDEAKTSQSSSQVLPMEEPKTIERSNGPDLETAHVESLIQARPVSAIIPPNLWEKAYHLATRKLRLPNLTGLPRSSAALQDIPAGCSVDRWMALNRCCSSSSEEDDEIICAFNLVTPELELSFRGDLAEAVDTTADVTAASAQTLAQTHLSEPLDSNVFEYNSPVIIAAPDYGTPATDNCQGGSYATEIELGEEHIASQSDQASDFESTVGHDLLAFLPTSPPTLSHPSAEPPTIQRVLAYSERPWLGVSNRNRAGTAIPSQTSSSGNTSQAEMQVKIRASEGDRPLAPNSQNARILGKILKSSQSSAEFTQPNRVSTNCFSLFEGGSDDDLDD
ncbi:hypothetical protein FRC07_004337 [Ceratobasidium sp. 392]|nr:hypothetical protein FRC07_004337 [Ceratobasidium sp. 392]